MLTTDPFFPALWSSADAAWQPRKGPVVLTACMVFHSSRGWVSIAYVAPPRPAVWAQRKVSALVAAGEKVGPAVVDEGRERSEALNSESNGLVPLLLRSHILRFVLFHIHMVREWGLGLTSFTKTASAFGTSAAIAAAVSFPASTLTSATTTLNPRFARRNAMARPKPVSERGDSSEMSKRASSGVVHRP